MIMYFVTSDQEQRIFVGESISLDTCEAMAIEHIKMNPDAKVCVTQLHNRYWKCSSTGKIRSDDEKDLENKE